MTKVKEPTALLKLNEKIALYGGLYARWKCVDKCKGNVPTDVINLLVEVSEEVDKYLRNYKERLNV